MKIELDHIYNMDCLEGMKHIPDQSIDAIICDLPYGVLNKGNKHTQWDSIIPFDKLWEQYLRIAKPTTPIILFAQGMFTADLMHSNRKMWRYNLVWDKGRVGGFLNSNRMPLRQHEDIAIFYKKLPVYNPQMMPCAPHARNHGRGSMNKVVNRCYGNFTPTPAVIADEKFPTSILPFNKEHDGDQFHPTQKPVDLLRYLVLTYTNSGGG